MVNEAMTDEVGPLASKKKRPKKIKPGPSNGPITPAADPVSAIADSASLKKEPIARKERLKEPWLEAFRKLGTILAACQAVPVGRRTIQEWRHNDPDFRAKFLEAELDTSERIEHTVIRRAVNGDKKPLIRNGKAVLDENGKPVMLTEYPDALQIFLLKCRLPHKYQERIKQQIDLRIVHVLSSEFLAIIRRHVPDACGHCKVDLSIMPKIQDELERLSAKLGSQASQ